MTITGIPMSTVAAAPDPIPKFGILWAILAAPLSALARDLFRYVYGCFADPPHPAGELRGINPEEGVAPARDAKTPSVGSDPVR